MRVSLKRFLETGQFGDLHDGATKAEIRERLGPPEDVGGTSRKYRWPSIWKYGDVELYVGHTREGYLFMIHMGKSRDGGFVFPESWAIEDWVLVPDTDREDAEEYLAALGLPYKDHEHFPNTLVVEPSGVALAFVRWSDWFDEDGPEDDGEDDPDEREHPYTVVEDGLWAISCWTRA